jgi:hypothetical protein
VCEHDSEDEPAVKQLAYSSDWSNDIKNINKTKTSHRLSTVKSKPTSQVKTGDFKNLKEKIRNLL